MFFAVPAVRRPRPALLASLLQVLRRATALTFLGLKVNNDLELHVSDVGAVFVHLRRLRTLQLCHEGPQPGAEKGWSEDSLRAVIKLCKECPWVDVDVSPEG